MKRLPQSGLYSLAGAALMLALLAGCTQPQKTTAAKAPTAQTARQAPAPQPAAAATFKPASKAHPGLASPAQRFKPTDKKPAPAKLSASAAQPRPGAVVAGPTAGTADATKKEGCGASAPKDTGPKALGAKAPGAKALDLTPPPVGQSQPKLVCKQTKVVGDPIWQGKEGTFKFVISNEGQAPLAIRVKPT